MKQNNNENAANRYSYVGNNYSLGENEFKNDILNSLPEEWSKLHKDGYIHIHDLDAYGQTYNCLTFDLSNFDYSIFKNAMSVLDSCFSTYTLSFDILLITEIKESHLL